MQGLRNLIEDHKSNRDPSTRSTWRTGRDSNKRIREARLEQEKDDFERKKKMKIMRQKRDGIVLDSGKKEEEDDNLSKPVKAELGKSERTSTTTTSLPPEEVKKMLRRLGEVVTFFGESNESREERLRNISLDIEKSKGQINEYHPAQKEERRQLLEQEAGGKAAVITVISDIYEEDDTSREAKTARLFIGILRDWSSEFDITQKQMSSTERRNQATFKQTSTNIQSLLKGIKGKKVSPDISRSISDIAGHLARNNFKKAHDSYFQIAIGNAPWPMGVTMVGIHERSGREKIFAQNTAHVLNDERSRKWLQSVKRLISYYQNKHGVDPSLMVRH